MSQPRQLKGYIPCIEAEKLVNNNKTYKKQNIISNLPAKTIFKSDTHFHVLHTRFTKIYTPITGYTEWPCKVTKTISMLLLLLGLQLSETA